MASHFVYFGCAVVFLTLINSAFSGQQCFECQAELGKNISCETNVWASKSNSTCQDGYVCAKWVNKIGNTTTLYRLCAPPNYCEVQRWATEGQINQENGNSGGLNQTLVSCLTCNTTLCNSVSLPSLNLGLFGVAFLGITALFL